MSTLEERLDRMRAASAKKIPDDAKAVMAHAGQDLRDSGIIDRIPSVGNAFIPFELVDTKGNRVRSADLLARGPLVVSVYRGVW